MASVRKRGKTETYEVRWHIGSGLYGSEGGLQPNGMLLGMVKSKK